MNGQLFYGWIPNTLGRISFAFAGIGNTPTPFITNSNLRENGRFLACYQRRDCSDTTLPIPSRMKWLKRLIDRHYFMKTGDFQFVGMLKKSANNQYIKGKVFIFLREDWKNIEITFKEKMEGVSNIYDNELILSDFFSECIPDKDCSELNFRVERNGEFTISVERIDEKLMGDLSEEFDRIEHEICAQAYFFVKDIFHTHKFHDPTSDTVLDISRMEKKWKSSVNNSLARKAIAQRRMNSSKSLVKSAGIIAYLESFRRNVMDKEERKNNAPYDFKSFQSSLNSALTLQVQKEKNSVKINIQKHLDAALAFVILLLAIIPIMGDTIPTPSSGTSVFVAFAFYLKHQSVYTILTVVFVVYFLKFLTLYVTPEKEEMIPNIARISLAFDRHTFPMVLCMVATIITISGIGLLAFIFHVMLSLPK